LNGPDIYREGAPPAEWRSTVACCWTQTVGSDRRHRVVPDGCADIIVGFGAPVAVGLADEVALHDLRAGSSCRAIRLRPEAVTSVLGVPGEELRNASVRLDDVVGAARARHLVDVVLDGAPDERLATAPDPRLRAALDLLGTTTVDDTADQLGLSARQLRRLVTSAVGLGPKTFQRVLRLQRFLAHGGPLAEAAADAGYADQPHLTREVTRLCGLPPGALREERT
jgi:AraC-like DNA-binding protein